MCRSLSPRQTEILDFMERFAQRHGYCPTFREIERGTDIPLSTLHREVKQLETLHVLHRDEGRVRALRLVSPGPAQRLVTLLAEYDVVGLVQARYGDDAASRLAEALAAVGR